MSIESIFDGYDIICSYTWDDAINDGIFMDISGTAKKIGFIHPTAITTNLFNTLMKQNDEEKTQHILESLLVQLKLNIQSGNVDGNYCFFKFDLHDIIVVCEGRSPTDLSPIMTIMLPEDR